MKYDAWIGENIVLIEMANKHPSFIYTIYVYVDTPSLAVVVPALETKICDLNPKITNLLCNHSF